MSIADIIFWVVVWLVGSLALALYGLWLGLCAVWDFVTSWPFLSAVVFCLIVWLVVKCGAESKQPNEESKRSEEKPKSYDQVLKELIGQLVVDLGAGPKQLSEYVLSDETIDANAEAYKCFMKEAEHGALDGKLGAGICCAAGIGHARDLAKARLWLEECAKLGDEDAKQLLASINEDKFPDIIECPNCGHGVHVSSNTCWFCDHPLPSVCVSAKQQKVVVSVLERLVGRMKSSDKVMALSSQQSEVSK